MIADDDILRQLIHQVSKATPRRGTERDVVTVITRPMWQAWCRAAGSPEGAEPTDWLGIHDTHRVYGSRTIVVDADYMAAISYAN